MHAALCHEATCLVDPAGRFRQLATGKCEQRVIMVETRRGLSDIVCQH